MKAQKDDTESKMNEMMRNSVQRGEYGGGQSGQEKHDGHRPIYFDKEYYEDYYINKL